uniref:T9SS type A sorting domain-containing protein n=1 Tax=candidate division WOR-3 bacterium TaxID=2052148 RepID=A0A7C6AAT3_UNCW3
MKKLLLVLPIILYAQVIDTVIPLFDEPRERFLYIPDGNKLYINLSQSHRLLVLDCSTYAVRKIIPLPSSHFPCATFPFWYQKGNKIYYVFNIRPESIAVIDNRTDSIIKWIPWRTITPIVYNSKIDKIYASARGYLGIIDPETDSVVKIIPPSPYPFGPILVWDSIGDKLYTTHWEWGSDKVIVLNCLNDSVIAVISTRISPAGAVYNPLRRKIYLAPAYRRTGCVICAKGDTVIKYFYPVTFDWAIQQLIWNGLEDKVYWPGYDYDDLYVIDCETDSIIKTIRPPPWISDGLRLNHSSNLLYIGTRDTVGAGCNLFEILDCHNDSVISQIRFGGLGIGMEYHPIRRKIFIGDLMDSALYVIGVESIGIEESHLPHPAFRQSLAIYPNPAKSVIRVRWSREFSPFGKIPDSGTPFSQSALGGLKIFDVSGKLIKEVALTGTDQEIKIPLKGIKPGIYFLQLGKETKKFMVVK